MTSDVALQEQYEDKQERLAFRKVSFWQHMATYLLYFVMLMNIFVTTFGISGGRSDSVFATNNATRANWHVTSSTRHDRISIHRLLRCDVAITINRPAYSRQRNTRFNKCTNTVIAAWRARKRACAPCTGDASTDWCVMHTLQLTSVIHTIVHMQ